MLSHFSCVQLWEHTLWTVDCQAPLSKPTTCPQIIVSGLASDQTPNLEILKPCVSQQPVSPTLWLCNKPWSQPRKPQRISKWHWPLKMAAAALKFFVLFLTLVYLFIWLHWVFTASRGLSLVLASRGFSLQWLLLFWSMGSRQWASVVVAHKLRCPAAHGILPDQGWMEPVSPALAGEFLTIGPPG